MTRRTAPAAEVVRLVPPAAPAATGRQQELALEWVLPSGLPAQPRSAAVHRHVRRHGPAVTSRVAVLSPAPSPSTSRSPSARDGRPDPATWAGTLVQAVLETLAGDRPATQLLRWLELPLYERVQREAARRPSARTVPGARRASGAVVRTVHLCEPRDGVVEATVVVSLGARTRAVALRLEGASDRWRCTRLAIL